MSLIERNMKSNDYGQREDILDVMVSLDEKQTPFLSAVKKGSTPRNTYVEWHVDKYADASVANAVIDGTDVQADIQDHDGTAFYDAENHAANRDKLATYLQMFRRVGHVSRLAQEINVTAGVSSEYAKAVQKKTTELGRDIEATCLGYNDHLAETSSVPYRMRGLGIWLLDSDTITNGGVKKTSAAASSTGGNIVNQLVSEVVPSAYRPSSDQTFALTSDTDASNLTETVVQDIMQSAWDATGMNGDYKFYAGSEVRRQFTSMSRNASQSSSNFYYTQRNFEVPQTSKKIQETTTIYEGDFGIVEICPSNFIGQQFVQGGADNNLTTNKTCGYLLDMDQIELKFWKRPTVERFEDRGGGPRFLVEAGCALCVTNPLGMGSVNSRFETS